MTQVKTIPGSHPPFGQRADTFHTATPASAPTSSPLGISGRERIQDRRQHERVQVSVRASVLCHGRYQPIFIRDISCGGLMMADAFGLAVGDTVTVTTLTGDRYQGRVAWSVSPFTGMKFDHRIDQGDPLFARRNRLIADRNDAA